MSKLVIVNLGKGNLTDGFPFVTVQLREDGKTKWREFNGSLSAAPNIIELYRRWQLVYQLLYEARALNINLRQPQAIDENIEIYETEVTHVSDADLEEICEDFATQINTWLDSQEFRRIDRQLRRQLTPDEIIRVIIQTEDNQLRKLPWHLWQFFQDYHKAEVALSSLEIEPVEPANNPAKKVRILAILGDSTGIDVEADRRILENLPDAKTVFMVEPQRQKLDEQLRNEQGWDILFFAGHSSSQDDGEKGYIYINPHDKLSIYQLKNALVKARERGLQFAIFNSCDGLGLAQQLDDLHIPQIIVMREPVPDRVAQNFLMYFINEFSQGQPFSLAVREARQRLQGIEGEFPGASWLPMICQNPAEVPPTWEELRDKRQHAIQGSPPPRPPSLKTALIASVIVASLLMGMRWLGILQSSELQAFDHFMQLRPSESTDSRILLVEANEEDIKNYGFPLPDAILGQLLDKLEQHNPIVIGLDIYRDKPVLPGHEALVSHLQHNPHLITACKFGLDKKEEGESVPPPPASPIKQVGFINVQEDQYRTTRRYLLSRAQNLASPFDLCSSNHSFSFQLAFQYLTANKVTVKKTPTEDWQFGKIIFKRLEPRSGGYQNLDARGYQVLINYRKSSQIGKHVRLSEILTDRFDPKWIKDKIVLIGVTAGSIEDDFNTPYGEMRGLFVHAQMISQILSSAIDGKYLPFWWLPQWGDTIWVWFWSLTGGLLVWRFHSSRLGLWLAVSISIAVLYALCLGFFIRGGWLPLIPSVLALVATGVAVVFYSELPTRKLK